MPRIARAIIVDYPLHVVQRGINRNDCFFQDADYRAYLDYLHTFAERFNCSVHAYCLMTNHVHLLLTPHRKDGCGLLMKNLAQNYVQRVNYRLGRTGTLWEGRYHSSLVLSESYALACYRYIETNPVRARLAAAPAQYRWSSFNSNGEGKPDALLRQHAAYVALGLEPERRTRAYAQLCGAALPEHVIED